MREPWHAPGSALPRHSQPVSLSGTWSPRCRDSIPRLCPPRPSLPVSPSLSPLICFLSLPSLRRSLFRSPRLSQSAAPVPGTPLPPLPAPPALGSPAVTGCVRAPLSPPLAGPSLPPASWQCRQRRLREGTGWGHCHPPPDVPGVLGWGRASSRGARVPAPRPGPGPPGARPDGLHGELGVLRGAGTRAPLQSPAPRESPVPGVGPGLGTRGFSPRRKQAAPASGRALREWVWGEGGRQSPAHLRQVRSHSRKVPVSDWEVGSKGRLPQGGGLNQDQVKAQLG